MKNWNEIEKHAERNGFIPQSVYLENASNFKTCKPQSPEIAQQETDIWGKYLSATGKGSKNLYSEMYRYEWYEGRKRNGFWGNIENAIKKNKLGDAPNITIFSAGSGRDLLKVCLAAGVWGSTAPKKIKGTYKEINSKYFTLQKPNAKIIVTEYDDGNYSELTETVNHLKNCGLLTDSMIYMSRWNFREKIPVANETQDIVVFSLTGNYATKEEQPLILQEIARCIKKGGYFIGSTLSSDFDFNKARSITNKLKLIVSTPLGWPIFVDFLKWQAQWGKMAGKMNKMGYWANISAKTWAEYLLPAGMKIVRIYSGTCKIVPVEVLVTQKNSE